MLNQASFLKLNYPYLDVLYSCCILYFSCFMHVGLAPITLRTVVSFAQIWDMPSECLWR